MVIQSIIGVLLLLYKLTLTKRDVTLRNVTSTFLPERRAFLEK